MIFRPEGVSHTMSWRTDVGSGAFFEECDKGQGEWKPINPGERWPVWLSSELLELWLLVSSREVILSSLHRV